MNRILRQNSPCITVVSCSLVLCLVGRTTAGLRRSDRNADSGTRRRYCSRATGGRHTLGSPPSTPGKQRSSKWGTYIVLTANLRQRGSARSNPHCAEHRVLRLWPAALRLHAWANNQLASEFLAVAAIVLLNIILRQHGHPEYEPALARNRKAA